MFWFLLLLVFPYWADSSFLMESAVPREMDKSNLWYSNF